MDLSNFASKVSTSLHTKCRRAQLPFSDSENMCFRSTASTALLDSLLTLRSRRPFERVFFFFVVAQREFRPDRHLALT
jgi:hypothetical protein